MSVSSCCQVTDSPSSESFVHGNVDVSYGDDDRHLIEAFAEVTRCINMLPSLPLIDELSLAVGE